MARLCEWAAQAGALVVGMESEVGSGMNGSCSKLRRMLADPKVVSVVARAPRQAGKDEHRTGGGSPVCPRPPVVVIDAGEVDDDLACDMTEVLTSFCARLYSTAWALGPRGAGGAVRTTRRWPQRAVTPGWDDGLMSHRGPKLRRIAEPFVIAPPSGARIRTRLVLGDTDREVLQALGSYLGSLASADLAKRVGEGKLDAKARAASRRVRKQALTARSSSRWAGAITRTTEDTYGLAIRNLQAERVSLLARVKKISGRVRVPIGEKKAKTTGYLTPAQRWQKQRRAQHLSTRLADVQTQLEAGVLSICRGGKRLATNRHNLKASGRSIEEWRQEWHASRWFLTADGEADKRWGNETIR